MELFVKIVVGLKPLPTFSKASYMFHQALNTAVYMKITFAIFLLCSLFLVWCNQSIDAARLPLSRTVTIEGVINKEGNPLS